MVYWDPCCVVDVDLDGATDSVVDNIREALANVGAMPRIQLAHSGARHFLDRRDPERSLWVVGRIETLSGFDGRRNGKNFATLEVDGLSSSANYKRLLDDLFDAGVVTFLRLCAPHGEDALPLLRDCSAPWFSHTSEDLYGCPLSPFAVTSAGRVAGRAIESFSPEELSQLLGPLDQMQRLPMPFAFTAPDGTKYREYFAGGSQAVGWSTSVRETEVSLGFPKGKFDDFFRTLGGSGRDFSQPFFLSPAVGVVNGGGDARVARRRGDMSAAVLVAATLVRGDTETAKMLLGLAEGETWFAGERGRVLPVDLLPEEVISGLVTPALSLLASACGVVAASRVPREIRERAARSLAYLGAPNARRIAHWLREHAPDLGDAHLKGFRGDAAKRAKRRTERPRDALNHLRDQLDRLKELQGGAA